MYFVRSPSSKGICSGGCLDSNYALQHSHITKKTDLYSANDLRWTCGNTHPQLCKACYNSPTCPVDGLDHSLTTLRFRLLTWNVDGLDKRNPVDRATAVCSFIKAKLPHAVFLQEVVPETLRKIIAELSMYDCYSPHTPQMPYFAIILVHSKLVKVRGGMDYFDFPSSNMGRHLLQLPVSFAGVHIDLFTSHLESTKASSEERIRQLKITIERIQRACKEDPETSCLFGGDLNLRDSEVAKIQLPPDMTDVWEGHGSPGDRKFTWDTRENDNLDHPFPGKPRCRFDRVYLLTGEQGSLRIPSLLSADRGEYAFELVGKVRLRSCGGRFPSDHWGVWTEFVVDYPEKVSITQSSSS